MCKFIMLLQDRSFSYYLVKVEGQYNNQTKYKKSNVPISVSEILIIPLVIINHEIGLKHQYFFPIGGCKK